MERTDRSQQWSLLELTQAAGVSVRTVRYYIAEGLLPPADASGPRASYNQVHLDRLRLIDQLKANYLPLKEIRRRLSSLTDEEVHDLVTAQSDANRPDSPTDQSRDRASDYIARLLSPAPQQRRPAPAPAQPPRPAPRLSRLAEDTQPALDLDADLPTPPAAPPLFAPNEGVQTSPPRPDPTSWRRVQLTDDAELLIRDDVYQRKRDRIDWLIDWAKKVFD